MAQIHLILVLFSIGFINCANLCGDWTQYEDIKCVKVLEETATEEQALEKCTQLDRSSVLLSIHSEGEQNFLNNILEKYNYISNNAWIGMKYNEDSYKWSDGTETNFTNWAKDAVRDGTDPCVQMSLVKLTLGKWSDELCKKSALVVCQKGTGNESHDLKQVVDALVQVVLKQQEQIKALIPIGFLYTQLPNQSSPEQLWPNMSWTEVTEEYSGLFFRAEGKGAETFGQIQQANQSWLSNVTFDGFYDETPNDHNYNSYSYNLKQGGWGGLVKNGPEVYARRVYDLKFFTTEAEVRPKNTAIKIWKRTE